MENLSLKNEIHEFTTLLNTTATSFFTRRRARYMIILLSRSIQRVRYNVNNCNDNSLDSSAIVHYNL